MHNIGYPISAWDSQVGLRAAHQLGWGEAKLHIDLSLEHLTSALTPHPLAAQIESREGRRPVGIPAEIVLWGPQGR